MCRCQERRLLHVYGAHTSNLRFVTRSPIIPILFLPLHLRLAGLRLIDGTSRASPIKCHTKAKHALKKEWAIIRDFYPFLFKERGYISGAPPFY